MPALTKDQTSSLAKLLIIITGEITENDQGKFIIPSGLIEEISQLSPGVTPNPDSLIQSQDFKNILAPREELGKFSGTLELGVNLTRGNIRKAYNHILGNGVDEKGEPISPEVVKNYGKWVISKNDNNFELSLSGDLEGNMAKAFAGNIDAIRGTAWANVRDKSRLPPIMSEIATKRSLGGKPVMPQRFIQKVREMMDGNPDENDEDIKIMRGIINFDENGQFAQFKLVKDNIIKRAKENYLAAIEQAVDEKGVAISPEFIARFRSWVSGEKNQTTSSSQSSSSSSEAKNNEVEDGFEAAFAKKVKKGKTQNSSSTNAAQVNDNSDDRGAVAVSNDAQEKTPSPSPNQTSSAKVTEKEKAKSVFRSEQRKGGR